MSWYETATWYPYLKKEMKKTKDWSHTLRLLSQRRKYLESLAEKRASSLGHTLGAWDIMHNSRCNKCGDTVHLNNVLFPSDSDEMQGRAVSENCRIKFES